MEPRRRPLRPRPLGRTWEAPGPRRRRDLPATTSASSSSSAPLTVVFLEPVHPTEHPKVSLHLWDSSPTPPRALEAASSRAARFRPSPIAFLSIAVVFRSEV